MLHLIGDNHAYLDGNGYPMETRGEFTSDRTRIHMITDKYDELIAGFGEASAPLHAPDTSTAIPRDAAEHVRSEYPVTIHQGGRYLSRNSMCDLTRKTSGGDRPQPHQAAPTCYHNYPQTRRRRISHTNYCRPRPPRKPTAGASHRDHSRHHGRLRSLPLITRSVA